MKCKYLEHQVCIRTTGEYRLCCASLEPVHHYNVKTHTIDEWLNSDIHKEARDSISKGILPDSCISCKKNEEAGIISMRQKPRQYGPGLSHLDIRFNNQCNLRCVMCGPLSSSSIMQEHKEMGSKSPWGTIHVEECNWYNEDIADELSKIPTLKEVYLTGGEPFMVKGLDKFIDKLDRKVQLRFNTNGTLHNRKLFELLTEFDIVNLAFSIDGIGKVNDYIRYGSSWEEIEDNLHFAKKLNIQVAITPTIQIYNYPYIQQLRDYCKKYDIPCFDNILYTPSYFELRNMPRPMMEKYKLEDHSQYFNSQVHDPSQISRFVEVTKTFDSHRNISIHDYLPEVSEFYDFS